MIIKLLLRVYDLDTRQTLMTTPQLSDPAWSVIANDDTATTGLTYDEARALADKNIEAGDGAVITTDEAVRRMIRERIEI